MYYFPSSYASYVLPLLEAKAITKLHIKAIAIELVVANQSRAT